LINYFFGSFQSQVEQTGSGCERQRRLSMQIGKAHFSNGNLISTKERKKKFYDQVINFYYRKQRVDLISVLGGKKRRASGVVF
jgi:hypothetical protein